jgi:hypothetical protein
MKRYEDFLKANGELLNNTSRKANNVISYLLNNKSEYSIIPTKQILEYLRNVFEITKKLKEYDIQNDESLEKIRNIILNKKTKDINDLKLPKKVIEDLESEKENVKELFYNLFGVDIDISNLSHIASVENEFIENVEDKAIESFFKKNLFDIFMSIENEMINIHHNNLANGQFKDKFSREKDFKLHLLALKIKEKELIEELGKFYTHLKNEEIENIVKIYKKHLYFFFKERYPFILEALNEKKLFNEETKIPIHKVQKELKEYFKQTDIEENEKKLIENIFLKFLPYISKQTKNEKVEEGLVLSIPFEEPNPFSKNNIYCQSHYYAKAKIYNANYLISTPYLQYDNYLLEKLEKNNRMFNSFEIDIIEKEDYFNLMFSLKKDNPIYTNQPLLKTTIIPLINHQNKKLDKLEGAYQSYAGQFPLINSSFNKSNKELTILITEGFKDGENYFTFFLNKGYEKKKDLVTVSYRSAVKKFKEEELLEILLEKIPNIEKYEKINFLIGGDINDSRIKDKNEVIDDFFAKDSYLNAYLKKYSPDGKLGAGDIHNIVIYQKLKTFFNPKYIETVLEKSFMKYNKKRINKIGKINKIINLYLDEKSDKDINSIILLNTKKRNIVINENELNKIDIRQRRALANIILSKTLIEDEYEKRNFRTGTITLLTKLNPNIKSLNKNFDKQNTNNEELDKFKEKLFNEIEVYKTYFNNLYYNSNDKDFNKMTTYKALYYVINKKLNAKEINFEIFHYKNNSKFLKKGFDIADALEEYVKKSSDNSNVKYYNNKSAKSYSR